MNTETYNKAIIDGDFLIYIAIGDKTIQETENVETKIKRIKSKIDYYLRDILIKSNSNEYVAYLTSGKNFRYDVDSTYKGARKTRPDYFKETKEYLISQYGFIECFDIEADDACVILYNMLETENKLIVAVDKDIIKCKNVLYYNPFKKELGIQSTTEKEAQLNFWYSMITGDSCDGIKGLVGKGIKFAEKTLQYATDISTYPSLVMIEYINYYQCNIKALNEFIKNYRLLYIIDSMDGFLIPEFKSINKKLINEWNYTEQEINESDSLFGCD